MLQSDMKILSKVQTDKKNNDSSKVFVPLQEKIRRVLPEKEIQLQLGLKESPLNRLFEVRQKLDKFEDRLKLSHYWRNPMLWVMVFVPIIIMIFYLRYYLSIQNQIPDLVPLMHINQDLLTLFLPKYWLLILPASSIVVSAVMALLFRLSYRKLENCVFLFMLLCIFKDVVCYMVIINATNIFV